jgi:hypothetical protein
VLSHDRLEIYRDYFQHERRAEAEADSRLAQIHRSGRVTPRTLITRTVRFALAAMLLAASFTLAGAPTLASTCPAPGTGLPGALNMRAGGEGMALAMSVDNPNGNAGMVTAVMNSGC